MSLILGSLKHRLLFKIFDKKVIIDGSTIKLEYDGLFTIEDKNYIQVKGLKLRNLKSTKVNGTPLVFLYY